MNINKRENVHNKYGVTNKYTKIFNINVYIILLYIAYKNSGTWL